MTARIRATQRPVRGRGAEREESWKGWRGRESGVIRSVITQAPRTPYYAAGRGSRTRGTPIPRKRLLIVTLSHRVSHAPSVLFNPLSSMPLSFSVTRSRSLSLLHYPRIAFALFPFFPTRSPLFSLPLATPFILLPRFSVYLFPAVRFLAISFLPRPFDTFPSSPPPPLSDRRFCPSRRTSELFFVDCFRRAGQLNLWVIE